MHRGYIALWRKIQDNFLWKERRVYSKAEAWIDILMEVRHSEEPAEVVIGNKMLWCNYAESLYSLDTWAARWGWSKSKVKRVMDLFVKCSMIELKNETVTTRIKVLNYSEYDIKRNAKETNVKRKRNASETDVEPNKNVKNVNNEKNEIEEPIALNSEKKRSVRSSSRIQLNFETYEWEGITDFDRDKWAKAYPACNLDVELAKAAEYIRANPSKIKKNWLKYLTGWFGRSQERGGTKGVVSNSNGNGKPKVPDYIVQREKEYDSLGLNHDPALWSPSDKATWELHQKNSRRVN